jgi:hypothetical protein
MYVSCYNYIEMPGCAIVSWYCDKYYQNEYRYLTD